MLGSSRTTASQLLVDRVSPVSLKPGAPLRRPSETLRERHGSRRGAKPPGKHSGALWRFTRPWTRSPWKRAQRGRRGLWLDAMGPRGAEYRAQGGGHERAPDQLPAGPRPWPHPPRGRGHRAWGRRGPALALAAHRSCQFAKSGPALPPAATHHASPGGRARPSPPEPRLPVTAMGTLPWKWPM